MTFTRTGLALALVVAWCAIVPAPAATFVVTKLADTNDGACGADCSLREAIGAALPGDTVSFAGGVTGTNQSRPHG